uniref:Cytochrome c oxidase subunit 2 n=2 Tax=Sternaspis TaxID=36132 RepID=A0A9E8K0V6_9ANNE|nr:cytochrome c oxidase subunit II [Sternaspis chinensis]YP_010580932.1 cytochrome c oxidase subunit II [Sternaspis liui]UZT27130.1 cytochrome c oxidase subunit 2 [Sternaspis chinensis]UZT27143.1 cytochrome c oxidase subunit 2 [Sternaspis liui]
MAVWGQLSLQEAVAPSMFYLIKLHDHACLILISVVTFVGYMLTTIVLNSFSSRKTLEAAQLETVWTMIPALILLFLALPSLRLLYFMDESVNPQVTLKTVGRQWYWSYEYPDFNNFSFDSYMVPTSDLKSGEFRLLEVDHRAILPIEMEIRVLVTAADVIHSWAVPSLGVKADAIPGRSNQLTIYLSRPGVYYGQCSEICGANHSFMPIAIEAIHPDSFLKWIKKFSMSSSDPSPDWLSSLNLTMKSLKQFL